MPHLVPRAPSCPPALIELDSLDALQQEIFGPVLHVVRYRREQLDALLAQINASGYGLTLGVHSRIDETIAHVSSNAHVGNIYVNRNIVGAVVGVQPFGGEGLSGTGPKAGGPLYLYHLLARSPENVLACAAAPTTAQPDDDRPEVASPLQALSDWAADRPALQILCQRYADQCLTAPRLLSGPTGERNTLIFVPRERVLCLASNEGDALIQLAAVMAVGCQVIWPDTPLHSALLRDLPPTVAARITLSAPDTLMAQPFDAAIYHGDSDQLRTLNGQIAARSGAIVSLQGWAHGETQLRLELLLHERAVSINTAAAGGNASLMTLS